MKILNIKTILTVFAMLLSITIVSGCNNGSGSAPATNVVPTPPANINSVAYILNQGVPSVAVCKTDGLKLKTCELVIPTDNAGQPVLSTGGASRSIVATAKNVYMAVNGNSNTVPVIVKCPRNSMNGLANTCTILDLTTITSQPSGTLLSRVFGLAINNNKIYFATAYLMSGNTYGAIYACSLGSDGGIVASSCGSTVHEGAIFHHLALHGNTIYVLDALNKKIYRYGLDIYGDLLANSVASNDSTIFPHGDVIDLREITINNNYAYFTNPVVNDPKNGEEVYVCKISTDGNLESCNSQFGVNGSMSTFIGPVGMSSFNNYLYVLNWGFNGSVFPNNLSICNLSPNNGNLSNCNLEQSLDSIYDSDILSVPISIAIVSDYN